MESQSTPTEGKPAGNSVEQAGLRLPDIVNRAAAERSPEVEYVNIDSRRRGPMVV